jgi:hypothetical protein
MALTVPQEVLDYFAQAGMFDRYTDPQGYQWMRDLQGGGGTGDSGTAEMLLNGYRRALNPGEDAGRSETTNLYYGNDGNYNHAYYDEKGWLNPLTGILAVATLGAGAQYLAAAGAAGGAGAGAGIGAADAAAAGMGGSGAFLGEGALSGIGAWDGALAGAGAAGTGTATMGAGMADLGGSGAGFVGEGAASGIPAWDAAAGSGVAGAGAGAGGMNWTKILGGSGGTGGTGSNWLGLGTTALGALGGAQGMDQSASSTRAMDPRMDALFYGDLAPRAQGLLGSQMPAAYAAGNQMLTKGSGLLGRTSPETATNPYLKSIADDMGRRTTDLLGQNNLSIQGNAVGTGGLGGSRQGVAQGLAASRAADSLQGQVAGLYGNAYEGDQNRLRQDWTLGAGLMGQGLNTQFQPLQNTANLYSPFTGFGTTTQNQNTGGGWMGALGGALGGAQMGKNMGWW